MPPASAVGAGAEPGEAVLRGRRRRGRSAGRAVGELFARSLRACAGRRRAASRRCRARLISVDPGDQPVGDLAALLRRLRPGAPAALPVRRQAGVVGRVGRPLAGSVPLTAASACAPPPARRRSSGSVLPTVIASSCCERRLQLRFGVLGGRLQPRQRLRGPSSFERLAAACARGAGRCGAGWARGSAGRTSAFSAGERGAVLGAGRAAGARRRRSRSAPTASFAARVGAAPRPPASSAAPVLGRAGALGEQAGAVARFRDPGAQLGDPGRGAAEVAAEPSELAERAAFRRRWRAGAPAWRSGATARETCAGPITAWTPGWAAIRCCQRLSAAEPAAVR